ncbi:hypothetical protein V6N11_034161 [Hibiscus sabdariffa]|uniref:Uncharacterized protein n=1 Tax=Hibiscus sabdariffa TaxID=183260 RepID=A0ABR2S1K6_9ROSI
MSCVAVNRWKNKDICSFKVHNKSFVDESHLLKPGLSCDHSGKQNKCMKITIDLVTVDSRNLISDVGSVPTKKSIHKKVIAKDISMDGGVSEIFGIASYNINDKQDLPVK